MSHANARLTPMGRLLIIQRIQGGMPQAHVAAQMGLSRATVAKWWKRWQADGEPGLVDRSSRPHRSPRRTEAAVEAKVCRLRRTKRLGPARIGARLGVPASTVHRVLVRNGLNRLSHIDRPTGRVIRRYERPHPGDLVHLDVKKVGKVPPGGGWRAHGRSNTPSRGSKKRPRVGYSYLHVAIDDHSRLAYVEALDNETADTLVGFFDRARLWFQSIGVAVDEVITDNGPTSGPTSSPTSSPTTPSTTSSAARTGPRQTAKQSDSTAPSQTNSSTHTSSDQNPTADADSKPGSTTTISTATTPPSQAHPHRAYTTSMGSTPRSWFGRAEVTGRCGDGCTWSGSRRCCSVMPHSHT